MVLSLAVLAVVGAQGEIDPKVFDNAAPWSKLDVVDGMTLDTRPITGSAFYEYRVSVESEVSVEALCEGVFEWGSKGKDNPSLKLRKLLKDGDDDRIVYDQVSAPVVSNRDYVLRLHKQRTAEGCQVRFTTTEQLAPPLPDGYVRITQLWGSWSFTPAANGKTKVVHTLFADPAGSVPAVFVHGSHRSSILQSVRGGLAKGKLAAAALTAHRADAGL
jgi:START domain